MLVLQWFSPQKVRIIFAIRTDRMGELDRLKHHIPTVLHDRFYLKPLDQEAAQSAITEPARPGHQTASLRPPFPIAQPLWRPCWRDCKMNRER